MANSEIANIKTINVARTLGYVIAIDPVTGKELTGKRKDLEEYIKTNIEFQKEYIAMLNKFITANDASYGNILDQREQSEITAQEESVEAASAGAVIEEKN